MLTIRLQRTGRTNTPTYRVVVAEHARPVKGKFLEIVGYYTPARDPVVFQHNDERITYWMSKGARPSNTLARLLKRDGMKGMEAYIESYTKKKSKKEEAAAASAAPAPSAPAATSEAPKAEAPEAESAPAEAPRDTEKKEE
jgi:small subunit ribosomal protein S16